jgi:acetoin utilization protein AcuB
VNTFSETERDRATLEKRAHQIMSHYPITVHKSCPIEKAARMMLEKGVSCLPVTSPDRTVEGILTWKDLFKAFLPPESDSSF